MTRNGADFSFLSFLAFFQPISPVSSECLSPVLVMTDIQVFECSPVLVQMLW